MSHFILVHGAWLDAACWHPVVQRLQKAGHTVDAPDLPGHGRDQTPLAGRTLEAYVARIVRDVDAAPGPVVLVGHSMGGIVISHVAEQRPERIARLVYLAAYLLGNGETIKEQQDPDSQVPPAMRPAQDWSTIALDATLLPGVFFHDVPGDVAAPLIAASAPEATAPLGTPLAVTDDRWGRVPRAYITTRADRALTPALQDRFLALRPCTPFVALESGHTPFASRPDELSAHLLAMAAGA